jgi:hypothetical protein
LTLYWAGLADEAIQHGLQAVETAKASEDPPFLMFALQHLGLSLSGAGRFDEALQVFDEARFREEVRCASAAAAGHINVRRALDESGDLDGAMARAFDVRELAHRVAFEPPLVSAGIDLLMIFTRRHRRPAGRSAADISEDRAGGVRRKSAIGVPDVSWQQRASCCGRRDVTPFPGAPRSVGGYAGNSE